MKFNITAALLGIFPSSSKSERDIPYQVLPRLLHLNIPCY